MTIPEVLPATTCSANGKTKEIATQNTLALLPENAIVLAAHWFNIPGHDNPNEHWHVVVAYSEHVDILRRFMEELEG